MTEIILLGYGKMGQEIEKIIVNSENFKISHIINSAKDLNTLLNNFKNKDNQVVIDFSNASTCEYQLIELLNLGCKVVSGTTGWSLENIKNAFSKKDFPSNSAILHSPNFSIGVNVFWSIIDFASQIIKNHNEYSVAGHEMHHIQKKDAPSGTAIHTQSIVQKHMNIEQFSYDRIDNHPGLHEVKFESENDYIKITHNAKSRKMFAKGALDVANWIQNKNGFFSMKDYMTDGMHYAKNLTKL